MSLVYALRVQSQWHLILPCSSSGVGRANSSSVGWNTCREKERSLLALLELFTQIPFPMFLPPTSRERRTAHATSMLHFLFAYQLTAKAFYEVCGILNTWPENLQHFTYMVTNKHRLTKDNRNTTASTWELLASKWLTNTGGSENKMWVWEE